MTLMCHLILYVLTEILIKVDSITKDKIYWKSEGIIIRRIYVCILYH